MSAIDTSAVRRPGAFLGQITTEVRNRAASRLSDMGPGTVLDVGCGNGLFFAGLPPTPPIRVGVDLDPDLLREAVHVFSANQVQYAHVARADAWSLPFPDGAFDHVLLLNTLINIPTDDGVAALLEELMRVCTRDGRVYVDIRNAANPLLRLRYWLHNLSADFVTRSYHLRQITDLFCSHGFRRVCCDRIGPRALFPGLAYALVFQRHRG